MTMRTAEIHLSVLQELVRRLETEELTVNDAIRLWPATVEAFNRFGIDACCGGGVSIREAALRDGAEPEALLETVALAVLVSEAA